MDVSLLLTVQTVIWLVVGLAFLAVPRLWVAPFGMRLDAGAVFFARLVGSAYLGLAIVTWLGRGAEAGFVDALALANLVTNGASATIHVQAVVTGLHNRIGWGPAALLISLTAAWLWVVLQ